MLVHFSGLVGAAETDALDGEIDDFEELDLAELLDVVFSASKHEQSIFWSPSAITVFSREDIESSGAISVADLLRRVPGFDVYEMKPSFPLVGARALTDNSSNLVLLLIDGREALVELSGWALWSGLNLDLVEVERIEVIRGPGSTLYGANAFAGVVNITTISDQFRPGGDIILSGGEGGHERLFGRVRNSWSLGGGTLDFNVGLGSERRTSPSDRRDDILLMNYRTHGHIRYRQGRDLSLSLLAGVADAAGSMFMLTGDFAAGVFYHYTMGQAEVGLASGIDLKAQVYHSRHKGDFHYRSRIASLGVWLADIPDFYIDTSTVDGQVQLDFNIGERLLLTGGVNLRYVNMRSDKVVPSKLTESRGAGFIHARWAPWDLLQLTGGLRLDLNTETEGALSPRAVAVFRPWPNHSFRLGYGLAFRKPAFVERQMHLQIERAAFPEIIEKLTTAMGNEDLVNEKVHSFEAGWRAHLVDEKLRVSVDLFYNIYEDMIYYASMLTWNDLGMPDILDSTFEFLNEDARITAVGAEAEVSFSLSESWTFWSNFGLRRVTDEEGKPLPSEPQLKINLGGCWSPGRGDNIPGPVVDLALHYVSSYKMPLMVTDETFEDPENAPLGNKLLVIGRLGYRLVAEEVASVEAGLTVRAPIGESFREYPGVPLRQSAYSVTASDFGGEKLTRLISFYLRGSF
jgi:iron complex outermembrane receptor protein